MLLAKSSEERNDSYLLAPLELASRAEADGFWPPKARVSQLPPKGDWTTWLLMGGRGSGKTRTGAEWVKGMVLGQDWCTQHAVSNIALVGETYSDVREVMVDGESGLLAIHDKDERPTFVSSRRRLEWKNGAIARLFSSEDPDGLRGPQFEIAWCDARTIWASLVAIAAALSSAFGHTVDDGMQSQLTDAAMQVVAVGASLVAVFGRLAATSIIE